jgi:hypothetical protein
MRFVQEAIPHLSEVKSRSSPTARILLVQGIDLDTPYQGWITKCSQMFLQNLALENPLTQTSPTSRNLIAFGVQLEDIYLRARQGSKGNVIHDTPSPILDQSTIKSPTQIVSDLILKSNESFHGLIDSWQNFSLRINANGESPSVGNFKGAPHPQSRATTPNSDHQRSLLVPGTNTEFKEEERSVTPRPTHRRKTSNFEIERLGTPCASSGQVFGQHNPIPIPPRNSSTPAPSLSGSFNDRTILGTSISRSASVRSVSHTQIDLSRCMVHGLSTIQAALSANGPVNSSNLLDEYGLQTLVDEWHSLHRALQNYAASLLPNSNLESSKSRGTAEMALARAQTRATCVNILSTCVVQFLQDWAVNSNFIVNANSSTFRAFLHAILQDLKLDGEGNVHLPESHALAQDSREARLRAVARMAKMLRVDITDLPRSYRLELIVNGALVRWLRAQSMRPALHLVTARPGTLLDERIMQADDAASVPIGSDDREIVHYNVFPGLVDTHSNTILSRAHVVIKPAQSSPSTSNLLSPQSSFAQLVHKDIPARPATTSSCRETRSPTKVERAGGNVANGAPEGSSWWNPLAGLFPPLQKFHQRDRMHGTKDMRLR